MKVFSKSLSEILTESSKHSDEIILHIQYDQIDEKNHKSQDKISHLMGEAGFNEIAKVIEDHKSFVYISDFEYALHAHNFLNEHSAAVSSSMYYKGLNSSQAENIVLSKVIEKKNKE